MDARHFDSLSRALSTGNSRRRLLALLATLPILSGLVAILDAEDAEGKGRRKRRKKAHKHGKGRRRKHRRKTCKPQPVSQTCAGTCGAVQNNCKKTVDCGSCDCSPACGACFACQGRAGAPGVCVPQEAGTPCGAATTCDSGTLFPQGSCDGDGICLSALEVSCAPYTRCDGNACATSCTTDDDCVAGSFCSGSGQCVGDEPIGEACTHDGQCASGFSWMASAAPVPATQPARPAISPGRWGPARPNRMGHPAVAEISAALGPVRRVAVTGNAAIPSQSA